MRVFLVLVMAALLTGCGSAGGTAGPLDISSVWYKHPTTGDVKECGARVLPGLTDPPLQLREVWQEKGYTEVEKCKAARSWGPLCD